MNSDNYANDRAIFQSCLNIGLLTEQLNGLYDSLPEVLDRHKGSVKFSEDDYQQDEKNSGWIVSASSRVFKVLTSPNGSLGRPRALGHATVTINLGPSVPNDPKIVWAGYGLAKVIVGWVPKGDDPWGLDDFELDHSSRAEGLQPKGKRWFFIDGDNVRDDTWFFTFPLTKLQSPEDIETLILAPVLAAANADRGIIDDADLFGEGIDLYLDADGWNL